MLARDHAAVRHRERQNKRYPGRKHEVAERDMTDMPRVLFQTRTKGNLDQKVLHRSRVYI